MALVRDRTVEPARVATRAVVYGLLAVLVAIPASSCSRSAPSAASCSSEQGYAWAAWLTLGGIFVIAGAFCWTKRNP